MLKPAFARACVFIGSLIQVNNAIEIEAGWPDDCLALWTVSCYTHLWIGGATVTVQTITLHMPGVTYQRAHRMAEAMQRPVEDVLVDALNVTLPSLDDVPADMEAELAAMACLSDDALEAMARMSMPTEHQRQLDDLLDAQNQGDLDVPGQRQLATLMAEYGRAMLRRAQAVALLSGRGHPLPPLDSPLTLL